MVTKQELSSRASDLLAKYAEPWVPHWQLKYLSYPGTPGNRTKPILMKDKQTGRPVGHLYIVQPYPATQKALVIEYPTGINPPDGVEVEENPILGRMHVLYRFDSTRSFRGVRSRTAAHYLSEIERILSQNE